LPSTSQGSVLNNNNVTNNHDINVSVNDFANTDCKLVIESIVRSPAYIQLADEQGLLTEAIIDETHFSGDPRNRNVFSIDKKGKYMTVMVDGKRGVVNKKLALARSMSNNHQIINSPMVKTLLIKREETHTHTTELKRYNAERNKHELTFAEKGHFQNRSTLKVPEHLPTSVGDLELKTLLMAKMASIENPFRQETTMYKDVVLHVFTTYAFVGGRWFKSRGEGWEVCYDDHQIQKDIHSRLNKMKNTIRQEIPALFDTTVAAHMAHILDYFPDRQIADDAIGWMKESA
jgi:hypothetical protein